MTLKEIAQSLQGQLYGPEDLVIKGPAKIEEAEAGQITFLSNPKYKKYVATTKASAIIVDESLQDVNIPHIKVADPYVGFLSVLKLFASDKITLFKGISAKADIDKTTVVGKDCYIGPFVSIGRNSVIGNNTLIFPGTVIDEKVKIGNNCILYPNVSIREDCEIGDRVILHNGCVIGSDGFGFAPHGNEYIKIPQLGNVILKDDVEIGANSTIDRATVGSTVIKRGTKIDNLVQVAHNCIIGENTVIAAQSGFAGSTQVGDNVTIGGQVGVTGHIEIGNKVIVAAQSGISKSIPENTVMMGSPAVPIMQRKRIDVSLRHLPDYAKKLNDLEKEIIQLKKILDKEEE